tara:strand:+ start:498 stop:722 length:225 start_codon:yes stop_codon:yes gene_type:complete
MFTIDNNLQKAILIFIIFSFIIYNVKPKFFFKENNDFRDFGIGGDKTIVPYWLFTLVIGLLSYLFICIQNDDFV